MDQLNAFWIILGIVVLVLGPGGAAFVASRGATRVLEKSVEGLRGEVHRFRDDVGSNLDDLREWMKSLEHRSRETDKELYALKAVQADRDARVKPELDA